MAMIGVLGTRQGGWPIHLIEHAVSGLYDVSHGLGLAHLITPVLDFSRPHSGKKILRLLGFLLHENTNHYNDHDTAIKDLRTWMDKI